MLLKKHLLLLVVFGSFFACKNSTSQRANLKEDILSNNTKLQYVLGFLDLSNGNLLERIPHDTIAITLTISKGGLQPTIKGTYLKKSNPIKHSEFANASVYRNFIDTEMVVERSCTLFLGDSMKDKDTIIIAPEIEEKTYAFIKDHIEDFKFEINDSVIKAPVTIYKNTQNAIISYERFGFLNHPEIPIQTHMYVAMPNSTDRGFYYKLLKIITP